MSDQNQTFDWKPLVLSIYEGDCILMIGPDAIEESIDGRSVSLMQLFSSELINQLPSEDRLKCACLNPAQLAQVYQCHPRDPRDLRLAAQGFFEKRMNLKSPALSALATLPFRLVIDTTPLMQMEKAFMNAGKRPIDIFYERTGAKKDLPDEFKRKLSNWDDQTPLVYHVFGSMKNLKSLVLAENDLVDLLVSVIKGTPGLPLALLSAFSAECSMLFLGFGVRHLSLRILLHVLNSGKSTNRSFALERFDNGLGNRDVEGVKLLFQQGQRIDFIEMGLDEFATQLCDEYRDYLRSTERIQSGEKTGTSPIVFISYCHEDASEAERVQKGLENNGVTVWRDRVNLRAGEDWNRTIDQVIGKDIDYFVLLQSTAFVDTIKTSEGFVIRELRCAQERATSRWGIFIIPVLVDEAGILDELSKYNVIDVRRETGIEKLASDINRDFQERRKTTRQ